jgi:FAD/FMN-containing dehydrogenase
VQVQALVKGSPKVRPAGLGHSFNRAVCADGGLMLDMSSMNDVGDGAVVENLIEAA